MNIDCNQYSAKKILVNGEGIYDGTWYLVKTTPTPITDIEKIIADFNDFKAVNIIPFAIEKGRLKHHDDCPKNKHEISLNDRKVVDLIKEKQFIFAVREPKSLDEQPYVFILDPIINHNIFPDHPHLNMPEIDILFPSSLCYIDNISLLGDEISTKVHNSILQSILWLFRHQYWEAYRTIFGKGKWLGPSSKSDNTPMNYISKLDPYGNCHCGSGKKYADCHLNDYLEKTNKAYNLKTKDANIKMYHSFWEKHFFNFQNKFYAFAKRKLLD